MPDGGFADPSWRWMASWARTHAGIVLENGRFDTFCMRLSALCIDEGTTPAAFLVRLQAGERSAVLAAVDAASTNYTEFFREREAFDRLRDEVYASLGPGTLRFWSAACSTGEEAHSLAIHARIHLSSPERVRVLGTDISERSVVTAERATYPNHRLHALSQSERGWLVPAGMGYQRPDPEVRALVTFRRLNLLAAPFPFTQPFQLVVCRNVLYYFDEPTRARVLDGLFDVTEPGGWLVTSFTDPVDEARRWIPCGPGFFRKGM